MFKYIISFWFVFLWFFGSFSAQAEQALFVNTVQQNNLLESVDKDSQPAVVEIKNIYSWLSPTLMTVGGAMAVGGIMVISGGRDLLLSSVLGTSLATLGINFFSLGLSHILD